MAAERYPDLESAGGLAAQTAELLEPPAYQLWLRKTAAVATAPY